MMKLKNNKRYYTFNDFLIEKFHKKVYKITIDAGFNCPNRDGAISSGGCIFCDESGSFSKAHSSLLTVKEQVHTAIANLPKRFHAEAFIAYFQAYSNTYASADVLKKIYDEAFCDERIVGISIGTRPDCLNDEKLDLISSYQNPWLELGLQSVHDKTLALINRGHDYKTFEKAYFSAKQRGIKVCVHLILGLPGENIQDMMQTAKILADLKVDGVKLHVLTVLEGAPLADIYKKSPFKLLSEDEYCDIVCDIFEILPPETSIHRVGGSGLSTTLIAPMWAMNKFDTMNKIDKIMKTRNSHQGAKYALL